MGLWLRCSLALRNTLLQGVANTGAHDSHLGRDAALGTGAAGAGAAALHHHRKHGGALTADLKPYVG